MITHLEPDILECEVKWALKRITMNKANGGDGIPVELFQIQKIMLLKCCTQYANTFGNSAVVATGQERQCQGMLKLLHNCTRLICLQSNA